MTIPPSNDWIADGATGFFRGKATTARLVDHSGPWENEGKVKLIGLDDDDDDDDEDDEDDEG